MGPLLIKLQKHYPDLSFEPGAQFTWSPDKNKVIYKQVSDDTDKVAIWSLLHEVGHALLKHNTYESDFELLILEVEAWNKAQNIAKNYDHKIDENHIQDCLDTYRDWLYRRSTCPSCTSCSLQTDAKTYTCFNCDSVWRVSQSRMCRPYRKLAFSNSKS